MKIEKLPSGAYRLRKMKAGKTYTVIVDYKPSAREAEQLMEKQINNIHDECELSFADALDSYIDLKRNVLSPSVLRGYKNAKNWYSEEFKNTQLKNITQIDVQKEINRMAKDKSPKTVRNRHGLISVVLKTFRPDFVLRTTLPQKEDKEMRIPTDAEVKALLEYTKGGPYEIFFKLAASCGLRRSEIYAITGSDVQGNILTINKACVLDEDGNKIIKTTKTTSSTRTLYIPQDIADAIKEKGYAVKGMPDSVTSFMDDYCRDNKIEPKFTVHSLRHYFVSTLSDKGISDENIIKLSGHKTDYVMKRVYRHAKNVEQAKQEASNIMSELLFS